MPTPQELTARFWDAIRDDRTVMLGLAGEGAPHPRPMTALLDGDDIGAVWFFTAKDTELAQALANGGGRALFTLADKGHDLFATAHGELSVHHDPAVIDRLWNPFVAAWFEDGKDDPKLALLRFDPEDAEIWVDGSSLVAGVKALLRIDPKRDYRDNVAQVRLS